MSTRTNRLAAGVCMAITISMLSAGCSTAPSGSGNGVVVADGGGTYHESLKTTTYEPCSDQLEMNVTSTSYDYTVGQIRAQVTGAKEWDVVSNGTSSWSPETQKELLQPLDYDEIDTTGFPEEAVNKYGITYVYTGNVVSFMNDRYGSDKPRDWEDFWDVEKFPGTRAMRNNPQATLEIALLADGVDADDLYPLDVDRAFKKLDELRSSTKVVWWNNAAEQTQFLANDIADLVVGWTGRIQQAQTDGLEAEFSLKGAVMTPTEWTVLKSSTNSEGAMKFIDCAILPERQAADAIDYLGNSPANTKAFEHIPEDVAKTLPTNPENKDVIAGYLNSEWWSENYDAVNERWQGWYGE